ncbi:MAG: prephenate dehydrogenase [Aquiluna sp.]|nr:prephenate dehydrogenase [Aquiluna sp.]
MSQARVIGPVKVVGSGLIGTSIGLALSGLGIRVLLSDSSPQVLKLAVDFGAGEKFEPGTEPKLVVVCVPPDVAASVISAELENHPSAVVTDVASVKATVLSELESGSVDITRYVGSHPMAGREQAGALAGRSDIFIGRPWVISAHQSSSKPAIDAVEALALDLGASLIHLSPTEHDRAVALVSHAPQLVSSLLAARLAESEGSDIALAGQGLRDTTRIAASDPKLWLQILAANSEQIAKVVSSLKVDLDQVLSSLEKVDQPGSLAALGKLLERGNQGVARIPGKHGQRATEYSKVTVMIDDKPGELARLLTEIGEVGINIEDLAMDHATGAAVGLPELFVLPASEDKLVTELSARGWKIVG